MDNSESNNFLVGPWNGNSNPSGNPLLYLNAPGNDQHPWLLSTHYANLSGGHGQGINLIGTQTIVHPRATVPGPSLCIPSHARNQNSPYNRFSRGSPMICSNLSSDFWPGESQYTGMYPAFPGQCDHQVKKASHDKHGQTVYGCNGVRCVGKCRNGSNLDPGSMLGYTQLPLACVAPSHLKDRIANAATKISAPKRSAHDVHWLCPICSAPLGRSQDRRRHILSHLPHWLQCPDPGCSWRGDRWENLNKHQHKVHPFSTQEPDKCNSLIYDPWPLVQGITEGRTPIEAARVIAISMVERRASELGKSMLWGDFWGRRGRKAQGLGGFIV